MAPLDDVEQILLNSALMPEWPLHRVGAVGKPAPGSSSINSYPAMQAPLTRYKEAVKTLIVPSPVLFYVLKTQRSYLLKNETFPTSL